MTPAAADVSPAADLFSLAGRTAVVTGASSGLGARFTRGLAAAGATVYATARRAERLEELAGESTRIRPVVCDVSREHERERLMKRVLAGGDGLDVLVNNAGIAGRPRALEEGVTGFVEVNAVNLVAPFHLACLAADAAGSRSLSIVNVTSILGLVSAAPVGGAGYSASKAGLIGLTRELAGQWGRRGIRVNALAPGWFPTEMNGDLLADPAGAEWVRRHTMLGRTGDGHELDGALLFLCSDASSYCTGQVIVVDGGWTARCGRATRHVVITMLSPADAARRSRAAGPVPVPR